MRLSSQLTFLIRTVMPTGGALMVPVLLFAPVPAPLAFVRWFLLAGAAVLLVESGLWFLRLKDVEADEGGLIISSGRASVRVPWDQVAGLQRPWFLRDQFARFELRTPTRFGRAVLFMLPVSFFVPWSDHPAIRFARERGVAQPPDEAAYVSRLRDT